MAEAVTLEAQKRATTGSQEARRLRRKGLVPGVVYGHKEATNSLSMSQDKLMKAIRHGARVVDLKFDGNMEKVLIRDVQWDHLGKELLHVDFYRVSADERIVVAVPIEIRGTAVGVHEGGVLDQPLHNLEIECLALSVPDSIRVNVAELKLGDVIHVRDLTLPEGVKAMTDAEVIVVHVTAKQLEPEAPVVAPAATVEQAEPEVIGRQKGAEEEDAEEK